MSEFMYDKEKYIEEGEKIIFENNTDSSFGVETGIIFHKSGLYDVDISNNHVVVSKVDERKAIEEAYHKGFCDGNTRNEDGCVGCRYDNVRIDRSPCVYCCNAYSNQWMAKEKSDEIKVGDEVKSLNTGHTYIIHEIAGEDVKGYNFKSRVTCCGEKKNFKKTGRHFPQVAELIKAMNDEQRNCSTCKYIHNILMCNTCINSSKWVQKEGAE